MFIYKSISSSGAKSIQRPRIMNIPAIVSSSFNVFAHEPEATGDWAGYSRYVNRHFNSLATTSNDDGVGSLPDVVGGSEGWQAEHEYQDVNAAITAIPGTAIYDDGNDNCLQITFPDGFSAGSGPIGLISVGPGGRRAYWNCAVYISSSFDGYGTPNKFFWFRGNWGNGPFISFDGSGASALELDFNTQDMDVNPGYIGNAKEVNASARIIERDKWYVIEVILIGNTAGNQDGEVHIYVGCPEDGDTEPVLAISATDLQFDSAATGQFGSNWPWQINPTWGGLSGNHEGIGRWYVDWCHAGGV